MNTVFNRTKIIATTGPAINSYEMLLKLVKVGVDVFRLNFSHGVYADHKRFIRFINKINREYKMNIGILADLQGPKIRIGELEEDIPLKKGDTITFTTKEVLGNKDKVHITYTRFPKDVKKGDIILLDDGKVELIVKESDNKTLVKAVVKYGEVLSSKKGVNLPNTDISLPCLTPKDLNDLDFALENNVDWIALSFVRAANDIKKLRKIVDKKNATKIIAKIEKPEGVDQIDDIIKVADAIMIARGDLGVEIPIDRMPVVQKDIVKKCIQSSKPVIIATQIMDSMIQHPKPTRAEITDVANAVYDGADTLMLSGETSIGKYPIEVIKAMEMILNTIEKEELIYFKAHIPDLTSPSFLSDAICFNACKISSEVNAKAIICMTRSGYTAFMVSSYRPFAKIFVFTDNRKLMNTLNLTWGTKAFYYDKFVSTDDTINDVKGILKKQGHVRSGDVVLNLASMPLHEQASTNMVKVSTIE